MEELKPKQIRDAIKALDNLAFTELEAFFIREKLRRTYNDNRPKKGAVVHAD